MLKKKRDEARSSDGIALVFGGIMQLAAWMGALISTMRERRRGWFIALLVLGLLGLEFFAMIAYFLAVPEDQEPVPLRSPTVPA